MDNWENTNACVLLAARNDEKTLPKCLESVKAAVEGKQWALFASVNDSADSSYDIIHEFASGSSAKVFSIESYADSPSAAVAKNRAVKLSLPYRKEFPAYFFMDADDLMGENRVNGLLKVAKKTNCRFVIGDWEDRAGKGGRVHEAKRNYDSLKFGPWATVIHESLVPDDGNFFPNIEGQWFEDLLLWHKMRYEGVQMEVAPGVLTHIYIRRDGSYSGVDIEEKVIRVRHYKKYIRANYNWWKREEWKTKKK